MSETVSAELTDEIDTLEEEIRDAQLELRISEQLHRLTQSLSAPSLSLSASSHNSGDVEGGGRTSSAGNASPEEHRKLGHAPQQGGNTSPSADLALQADGVKSSALELAHMEGELAESAASTKEAGLGIGTRDRDKDPYEEDFDEYTDDFQD